MCEIQTFAETPNAYVIYCRQCHVLQLMYDHCFVLNVNEEDFLPFASHLRSLCEAHAQFANSPDDDHQIAIYPRRSITLNIYQLRELTSMVSGAGALYEAYHILESY